MPTMDRLIRERRLSLVAFTSPAEHARQVLDDQVQITRAAAMLAPTPASLLAYGRAELERLAADPL